MKRGKTKFTVERRAGKLYRAAPQAPAYALAHLDPGAAVFEEIWPEDGNLFSLTQLQQVVGGYIELIYLPHGKIIVIDEEGKLKRKPLNAWATAFAKLPVDLVVGDAVLIDSDQIE